MEIKKTAPIIVKRFVNTLDDLLKKEGVSKKVNVFMIGANALGLYGLKRSTKDVDIYCNLNVLDAKQETDIVEKIAQKIDYRHELTNHTIQPYGYNFTCDIDGDYQLLDWFTSLDFSRSGEIDRSYRLYGKDIVNLFVPRLENLIAHKLAAFNKRDIKHGTDILEVWDLNSETIDMRYLKKIIKKDKLDGKWTEIYDIYPELSNNSNFPRKLA